MSSSVNRSLLFWMLGIVAAMGLIWGLAKLGTGTPTNLSTSLTLNDGDHLDGTATAAVKLVEYSDFQCPACAYVNPIVQAAKERAGDKLVVAFRHYPLTQIHPYAELAAQASEAAALQGKFWEMQNILFTRQNSWTRATDVKATLVDYAKELGLDTAKFSTDIDSQAVKDQVARDVTTGNEIKLTGTPTLYLNNEIITLPLYRPTAAEEKQADVKKIVFDKSVAALVDLINQAASGK